MIQNYQKNHDQKNEMIILSNTKLVLSLMKRFYQKSNREEICFVRGIVGLIKQSMVHFAPYPNYSFQRMQFKHIIGEMKRYLRDNTQVKISKPIKDLAYAILKEKEKYLNQYQRETNDSNYHKI